MSRIASFAAAAALLVAAGSASAEDLNSGSARPIDLGRFQGVAYYTVQPEGYRVVAGFNERDNTPGVWFEALLGEGQKVKLSSSRAFGEKPTTVVLSRVGDRIVVEAPSVY